jgi:hypothetical protein
VFNGVAWGFDIETLELNVTIVSKDSKRLHEPPERTAANQIKCGGVS